jgi:Zn ribbon nucleic-acid-binding protein
MDHRLCPQCSCDAASVLSFTREDGRFDAAVQCHVCGYEKPADGSYEDEQAAKEAATREWFSPVQSAGSTPHALTAG